MHKPSLKINILFIALLIGSHISFTWQQTVSSCYVGSYVYVNGRGSGDAKITACTAPNNVYCKSIITSVSGGSSGVFSCVQTCILETINGFSTYCCQNADNCNKLNKATSLQTNHILACLVAFLVNFSFKKHF